MRKNPSEAHGENAVIARRGRRGRVCSVRGPPSPVVSCHPFRGHRAGLRDVARPRSFRQTEACSPFHLHAECLGLVSEAHPWTPAALLHAILRAFCPSPTAEKTWGQRKEETDPVHTRRARGGLQILCSSPPGSVGGGLAPPVRGSLKAPRGAGCAGAGPEGHTQAEWSDWAAESRNPTGTREGGVYTGASGHDEGDRR